MEELHKQLQDAISRRDYAGAEEISINLSKARKLKLSSQLVKLKEKQKQRTTKVEDNFLTRTAQFNERWRKILESFQEDWAAAKDTLAKELDEERNRYREEVEAKTSSATKPSAEYLQLINCRDKAVHAKKFREAQKLQFEIDAKEIQDKEKCREQRTRKINSKLRNFERELDFKANRLNLRYKQLQNEIMIQKRKEFDEMELKFSNIRKSLVNAQKLEENLVGAGDTRDNFPGIQVALESSKAGSSRSHPKNPARYYLRKSVS